MVHQWMQAIWDGMRLTCPKCRRGRIYKSFGEMNSRCPQCGVSFEPNEGDFVGAITVAYSLTAVLIIVGVFVVELLTDLSATTHLVLWNLFGALFLIFGYRNMKGIWIGILFAMTDLRKDY